MAVVGNGGAGSPGAIVPTESSLAAGAGSSPTPASTSAPVITSSPASVSQRVDAPALLAAPGAPAAASSLDAGSISGATMNAVSSVFSSEAAQGNTSVAAGSSGQSDLPFLHDGGGACEAVVYTASAEGDWVMVAGFEGDGWFFV